MTGETTITLAGPEQVDDIVATQQFAFSAVARALDIPIKVMDAYINTPSATKRLTAYWQSRAAQSETGLLVASCGHQTVGFAETHLKEEQRWVGALYVNPAFHKRGIGSQLLKALLTEPDEARLQTTLGTPAVAFYQNRGFIEQPTEEVDEVPISPDYSLPQILMVRPALATG
jgi:GNAT superfamily N-acetyltransferase